jgi:hypothetical protein
MREPDYYDSQASAAAALNISIYDLRDAKAAGCAAFRSGRVYRAELLAWLDKHPGAKPADKSAKLCFAYQDWECRREMLFALLEFLHGAHRDRQISDADYKKNGSQTALVIVELGRAWKAEIDERGFLQNWATTAAKL